MRLQSVAALAILSFFSLNFGKAQASQTLNVYIDADFSITWQVARSIEAGLSAAFAAHDHEAAGFSLNIVSLDHRANARRSIENMRRFASDPAGIAVIGGMHSPPYIRHAPEINSSQIPLLLAWSANGALTRRAMGEENWIFRLSVDDDEVGPFLAREMLQSDCTRVGLVVLDNAWGQFNRDTITAALADVSQTPVYSDVIATDIGTIRARHIAAELSVAGVDCLGLVGNGGNSAALLLAVHESGQEMRVFSHWGLIAGGFVDAVPHHVREALQIAVVQSCGLDPLRRDDAVLSAALAETAAFGEHYTELSALPAPTAFVHAHDLGAVLVAAIEQAAASPEWQAAPEMRRALLRAALEHLETPVPGILRTYSRPFSEVTEGDLNGHEALSGDDLCLAQFNADNRLSAWRHGSASQEAAVQNP